MGVVGSDWANHVENALLKNPVIRAYLQQYSTAQWNEVVKLTCLQGIASLRVQNGDRTIPVTELKDIVGGSHFAVTVKEVVPAVQQQVDHLCEQLSAVQRNLGNGNRSSPNDVHGTISADKGKPSLSKEPPATQPRAQAAGPDPRPNPRQAQARVDSGATSKKVVKSQKPSSTWRQGDHCKSPERAHQRSPERRSAVPAAPSAIPTAVVPRWWPDENLPARAAPAPTIAPPGPAAHEKRPPPRLAYSKPPEDRGGFGRGHHPAHDDIVTPAYIFVASSGYGGKPGRKAKEEGQVEDAGEWRQAPPSKAQLAKHLTPPWKRSKEQREWLRKYGPGTEAGEPRAMGAAGAGGEDLFGDPLTWVVDPQVGLYDEAGAAEGAANTTMGHSERGEFLEQLYAGQRREAARAAAPAAPHRSYPAPIFTTPSSEARWVDPRGRALDPAMTTPTLIAEGFLADPWMGAFHPAAGGPSARQVALARHDLANQDHLAIPLAPRPDPPAPTPPPPPDLPPPVYPEHLWPTRKAHAQGPDAPLEPVGPYRNLPPADCDSEEGASEGRSTPPGEELRAGMDAALESIAKDWVGEFDMRGGPAVTASTWNPNAYGGGSSGHAARPKWAIRAPYKEAGPYKDPRDLGDSPATDATPSSDGLWHFSEILDEPIHDLDFTLAM